MNGSCDVTETNVLDVVFEKWNDVIDAMKWMYPSVDEQKKYIDGMKLQTCGSLDGSSELSFTIIIPEGTSSADYEAVYKKELSYILAKISGYKCDDIIFITQSDMDKVYENDKRLVPEELENGKIPDPNAVHPIPGYENEIYVKPTVTNPNITVGDFTYIADGDFESHVTNFYPWSRDKLIIGKFCQIAAGVEFIMNDANHQMNSVSTFPFYTLEGWNAEAPESDDMPYKGDTVIGNDVWIGQNAVILPGVHIGDGAIIGANCVVGHDIEPYTVTVGNPARTVKKRFDEELTGLLLKWEWWDKPIAEIDNLIPVLTSGDLAAVKETIETDLNG